MPETAATDPLGLVSKLLEGKYRIDAYVAEGGFGVVYAVRGPRAPVRGDQLAARRLG